MEEENQSQDTENPEETTEGESQASPEEEKPEGEKPEDWEAKAKKYKAIADRKSKQLEKVTSSLKEDKDEPKKLNKQESLSRDEAKLYAMGHTDEEVELAGKLAKLNGFDVSEAIKDDYFQAKVEERKQKEKSDKAQLGAAKGGSFKKEEEPEGREEHQKWYAEQMKKAGLN